MSSIALRCLLLRRIPGPLLLLPRRVPAPPPPASRSMTTLSQAEEATDEMEEKKCARAARRSLDEEHTRGIDDLRRVGYAGAAALAGFTLLVATMSEYHNRSISRP